MRTALLGFLRLTFPGEEVLGRPSEASGAKIRSGKCWALRRPGEGHVGTLPCGHVPRRHRVGAWAETTTLLAQEQLQCLLNVILKGEGNGQIKWGFWEEMMLTVPDGVQGTE